MRGLKRDRTARVIVAGHGFVRSLRRGFYNLGTDVPPTAHSSTHSPNWPSRSDRIPPTPGPIQPDFGQRDSASQTEPGDRTIAVASAYRGEEE